MSTIANLQDKLGKVKDSSGNQLFKWSTDTPTNTASGYAVGCLWFHTDGSANTSLYVNEGTSASATWTALGASTLTADELAAITGAASPDGTNVFATMADVVAGGSLADGKILLGNAANEPTAVTLTGDVTTTNAGVTAIGSGKVTNAMLAGSIAASKLANGSSGQVIVASAGGIFTAVSLSGDATVDGAGAVTIGAGKVTNAMLAGSIALSKLATNDLAAFSGAVAPTVDQVVLDDNGTFKRSTYQVFMDGVGDLTAGDIATTDTLLFVDATDGAAKIESIDDIATLFAGAGLTATNAVIALDVNNLSAAVVDVSADSIAILDATDSSSAKESIADFVTAISGNGLTATSGVIAFNGHELTEAVIADGDYIVFNDTNDSNAPKREALADLVGVVAGTASATGLTTANSVLTVAANAINAAPATVTSSVTYGVPVSFVVDLDGANLTYSYTIPAGRKLRVLDAYVVKTHSAGAAGDTVQVLNGATGITEALSLDVADKVRASFATIDDAQVEIAAAGTLVATAVEGGSDCDCRVVINALWVSAA